MTVRSTRMTVKLSQPFSLRGCAQALDPGVYLVDTDEQLLEGLSFCAYQRVKTFIHLHRTLGRPGTSRVLNVSGEDLDTAVSIGRAAQDRATRDQLVATNSRLADLSALGRADDDGMAQERQPA